MAESIRITLVALFFFRMCIGGGLADEMGFDTLLGTVFFVIMDYMSLSAHQKRAPTTSSWPLDGLGSHYRRRHKSFY